VSRQLTRQAGQQTRQSQGEVEDFSEAPVVTEDGELELSLHKPTAWSAEVWKSVCQGSQWSKIIPVYIALPKKTLNRVALADQARPDEVFEPLIALSLPGFLELGSAKTSLLLKHTDLSVFSGWCVAGHTWEVRSLSMTHN
jgi:hypothetical protein